MSQNPYTAPAPLPAAVSPPASLAGRILAPLLVPLAVVPAVLAMLVAFPQALRHLPFFVGGILAFVPVAMVGILVISPVSLLVLLPFRYMHWLKRGLLASLIQLLLVLALATAAYLYFGRGPIEVQLPERVG